MLRLIPGLPALVLIGCVSLSSLDGFPIPNEARAPDSVFFVKHQPKDAHHLEALVVASMKARGLNAVTEESKDAAYVVSYIDRWYWDMRMYLIDFRIDVRDANTNVLVATGRSYQTSVAAMGKTHQSVIDETVSVLVEGRDER